MGPKDDITDAFDDDELRRSIESADQTGEWRDADAKFSDPKLKTLAAQLAKPPSANYTERRFAELDRRAERKAAVEGAKEARGGSQSPDWRQTVQKKQDPAASAEEPAPDAAVAPATGLRLSHGRTIAIALGVFALAAVLQGLLTGFTVDLAWRAGAAGIASGIGWVVLHAGRFRAAAIAGCAHLAMFLSTADVTMRMEMTAVFLGLFIVLIGSGAAGMMQEDAPAQ